MWPTWSRMARRWRFPARVADFAVEDRADLLGGVTVLQGPALVIDDVTWADGTPMLAIPHFARNNRESQPTSLPSSGEASVDYSGGVTVGVMRDGQVTQMPKSFNPVQGAR